VCYLPAVTGLVMFFKPLIALAVFGLVIVPIKVLVLRYASPKWRAILGAPMSQRQIWTTWAATMGIVLTYASFAGKLW